MMKHWELFSPLSDEASESASVLKSFPEGLLYGYSVYTTLKLPLSEQVIDLHLQRLKKDCKALGLSWRFTDHQVLEQLKALFQPSQPVFRLTVMAQVDSYADFYAQPNGALPARLIVSAREAHSSADNIPPKIGLNLKTVIHQRPLPTVKHGAMAETILYKRQASLAGFDDVLLIAGNTVNDTADHTVLETSTANVFGVQDGLLRTPEPIRDGCLPGITRQRILEAAEAMRVPVDSSPLSLQELLSCQGVFICNAVSGVRKVERIDDQQIAWQASTHRLVDSLSHAVLT